MSSAAAPTFSEEPTFEEIAPLIDKALDYSKKKFEWFVKQLPEDSENLDFADKKHVLGVQDSFLRDIKKKLTKKRRFFYKFPSDKYATEFRIRKIDGEDKVFAFDLIHKDGREVIDNSGYASMLHKGMKCCSLKGLLINCAMECDVEDAIDFAGSFKIYCQSLYDDKSDNNHLIRQHYGFMIAAIKFAQLSDCQFIGSGFPNIAIATKSREAALALRCLLKMALSKQS